MKIAITGGSGFIGTRLIEQLRAEGHEVVIIDIKHDQPIDILDQEKLDTACVGCDVIYHLAAAHRDDIFPRSIYYETNGQGTLNVIAAAQKNNIPHIIFTSSVAVYALGKGNPDETSAVAPFNDYGKSKLEAEQYLQKWVEENQTKKVTIIRPVVVFGERNRGNVHTLIEQVSKGKFLMIGKGQNKKSMAYVGNVAGFLKYCLNQKENIQIFNYADKPDLTTQELLGVICNKLNIKKPSLSLPYSIGILAGYGFDILARITGKTLPISSIRIKKFCAQTIVDSGKAHATDFTPSCSLEEGVKRMIDHDFADKIRTK